MNLNPGDTVRLGRDRLRVLFTEEQIRSRVQEIGDSLRGRLGDTTPVFVGLLTGGFVFLADLVRAFGSSHEIDMLQVSRYDAKQKDPTAVRVVHDLRTNIKGRTVVVVEGIRPRGNKIEYVHRLLGLHQPRHVEYCALIRPAQAHLEVPVNETGFAIDNQYVVGYGLDLNELHRNLPFIGALETHEAGPSPA